MALLIDGSSPALASGTGAITTASFTPVDNSVLLIRFSGNTDGTLPSIPTITDSLGTPLTYTLSDWQSKADSPAVFGQAAIWTAEVTVGAAMTVTVTNNSPTNRQGEVLVTVVTGADAAPVGAHGKAGSVSASAITQNYTAQVSGGQGFGVCTDWDTVGNPSAGTGCTMDATGTSGTAFSYGFFRRSADDDSNGATNTLNVSLPGTSNHLNWCYIELVPFIPTPTTEDPPPFTDDRPMGLGAPNGWLNPWLGATDAPPQPLTMFVTARRGGNVFNGIALTVAVLTNAATVQSGAANSVNGLNPNPNLAITPSATGSIVYGAMLNGASSTVFTANGSTTYTQNVSDTVNGSAYATYRSTATTTAATPVTLGATAPAVSGGLAQAEILAAGTLAEDVSAPPPVALTGTTVANTVLFTPPAGALLIAMVSADGGTGVATMAVTSGGLVWTELVKTNVTGQGYVGVWIAQVPGAAAVVSGPSTLEPLVVNTPWTSTIPVPFLGSSQPLGNPATGTPQPLVVGPEFTPAPIPGALLFGPGAPDVVVASSSTPNVLVAGPLFAFPPIPGAQITASQPLGNPAVGSPDPLVVTGPASAFPLVPGAQITASQPLGSPAVGTPVPLVVGPDITSTPIPGALLFGPGAPAVVVASSSTPNVLVAGPLFAFPAASAPFLSASQPLGNPAAPTALPLVVSAPWRPLVPGALMFGPGAPPAAISTVSTPGLAVVTPPWQPVVIPQTYLSASQPLGNPAVPTTSPLVVSTSWRPLVPGALLFGSGAPAVVVSAVGTPQPLVVSTSWRPTVPGALLFGSAAIVATVGTPGLFVVTPPWRPVAIPRTYLFASYPLGNPAVASPQPMVVSRWHRWPTSAPALLLAAGGAVHSCTTSRPFTGTTSRPGSGITTRPDTGVTDNPC